MRFKFSVVLLVALLCGTTLAQKQPAPTKENNTSEWTEFSSAEGQFTVWLPGTPKVDIATVGTTVGPLKTHFFVIETEYRFLFYISYADLPASPQTPAENKIALDQTRDRAAAKGQAACRRRSRLAGAFLARSRPASRRGGAWAGDGAACVHHVAIGAGGRR